MMKYVILISNTRKSVSWIFPNINIFKRLKNGTQTIQDFKVFGYLMKHYFRMFDIDSQTDH